MQRRSLWVPALAAALSLLLGSQAAMAQPAPKKGGTINVGLNTDIVAVDPHTSTADVVALVFHHVFEGLIAHGDNFQLVPVLAEKWEVAPDFKAFTFHLRQGRNFHNGREMVADDVKFSVERIMKLCPRKDLLKNVDRLEVIDRYTVRLLAKEPDASILFALASLSPLMAIVPREEVEKQGGTFKHPVGTGPYKFVEWKPDRYVLLERFDSYKPISGPVNGYGGERVAYLDRIKFIPISEESVATMALLNKEIDFLQYVPFKDVEKFKRDYSQRGIQLDSKVGQSWYELFFGLDKPITGNVKFRQACAYAIDRQTVVQAAIREHGAANPSLVLPDSEYYTPHHRKWYTKDLNKARQLLQEAGYKGEEIEIVTNKKYMQMYNIAVAVQSELAAAGIKTRLNVVEWGINVQKLNKRDFQMMSYGIGPRPDPTMAYIYLRYNGFEDQYPRMKELMAQASRTLDVEKRKKIFEEAHSLVMEGVPIIMFYNYSYINAYWNHVKGYKNWSSQPRFWGVWMDK
ncbi:MAG TPA: ABC transporter substrate-binding protein [Thermodesulfobacteriota bacterium]|nr:ABC transporter substrate-binding protein [Thermodesulfobacteriota bacterium]